MTLFDKTSIEICASNTLFCMFEDAVIHMKRKKPTRFFCVSAPS